MPIATRGILLWHKRWIRRKGIGDVGIDRDVIEALQLPVARNGDVCPARDIEGLLLETGWHIFWTWGQMEFPLPIQQLYIGRGRSVAGESQFGVWIRAHRYVTGTFVPSGDQRVF